MKKAPLFPFFLISLFFTFYSTAFVPGYAFFPFAPFLSIAFNRYTLLKSLYLSCGCGLLMDLLSSQTPFGFHALTDVISSFCLYRFRLFFVEKALGITAFTTLFSLLSTVVKRLQLSLFGLFLPLTLKAVITDWLIMPVLDGFYAFLWFSCPLMLYHFLCRHRFRFIFLRKKPKKERKKSL